jgi:hypothetical protein
MSTSRTRPTLSPAGSKTEHPAKRAAKTLVALTVKPYPHGWENEDVSNPTAFGRRAAVIPTLPRGDVLGTYETYAEAQQVVDSLAKADFEVAKLAIVGNDLKTVERVTGKLTYGRAALAGAASGAWFGLFLGLLFFIFASAPDLALIGAAALIGAGFGMLFGVVSYAFNRRRRDFTSTNQVLASNYQIIIDPQLTAKAQALLSSL